jgi:hypothetical protein
MKRTPNWPRILLWTGLFVMLIGAVDPLEGSVVIVIGAACALLGAVLGRSDRIKWLSWAFGLVVAGVGILFGLSAMGGVEGSTGRSMWWALTILPYPAGWVLGLVGTVRAIKEKKIIN